MSSHSTPQGENKMKKKILFFAMVLFVVCLLTICVSAAEVDGIYYSFTNTDAYPGYDGTATVTSENRTKGTITEMIIPEIVEYDSDSDGTPDKKYIVTTIADSAFGSTGTANSYIVSVFIPKTISSIGAHAFRKCSNLESVVIEAKGYNPVTEKTSDVIFYNAEFMDCTKLLSVDLSNSQVTQVGGHCFRGCSSLTTAKLPETVTAIGSDAFNGCSSLTSINLPRGITSFGGSAFRGAKFGGDLIFDELNSLGNHAFRDTNIKSLVILGGEITSLGTDASLYGCTKLEILVLPETVTTAGSNTFTNCNSLKYIVASESFTSISSKPAKADIIIRGTDTTALQSAWSGWSVAPFSEFDPATAGTKTIYYGAVNAKDSVTTFVSFDGFDKEFSSWDSITNEKTAYAPIFEAQGYSTNADKTSIATGFSIAKASLNAYTSLIGGEVNFGIAIFNPKYLGADSFFNAEGGLNANGGCLTVDIGTEYSTCSLSVQGFNSGNSGIELVFVGFAYVDDISKATLIQKDYVGTTDAPVASPMVSKVTRNEGSLYTTTIASVCTPAEITTGKDGLDEFTA